MSHQYVASDFPAVELADNPPTSGTSAVKRKAAEDRTFADKPAKRSPPDAVDHALIKTARRRTNARTRRVACTLIRVERTPTIRTMMGTAIGWLIRSRE
jgi:hypothetical protein